MAPISPNTANVPQLLDEDAFGLRRLSSTVQQRPSVWLSSSSSSSSSLPLSALSTDDCSPALLARRIKKPSVTYLPRQFRAPPQSHWPPPPSPAAVHVTHVLDLDGFIVADGFLCKEMALVEVATNRLMSAHFRLGRRLEDLSAAEQKSVRHVTQHVHGIPFTDDEDRPDRTNGGGDRDAGCGIVGAGGGIDGSSSTPRHPASTLAEQHQCAEILLRFLGLAHRSTETLLVGYKGGWIEHNLLAFVNVPSVNLELLGCPKFDELALSPSYQHLYRVAVEEMRDTRCCLHTATTARAHASANLPLHCAKFEVRMFRQWYLREYLRL